MDENTELTGLMTVTLLSAFVANNDLRAEDLPGLIAATHKALSALNAPAAEPASTENVPVIIPAVTSRKSLASTDYILSMIDGKPYKTLRRHLSRHGLTPEQYRERYNLPATYPMIAPGYSATRSEMAKSLGFGRKKRTPTEAQPDPRPRKKLRAKVTSKPAVDTA